jgi:hypothetical protein
MFAARINIGTATSDGGIIPVTTCWIITFMLKFGIYITRYNISDPNRTTIKGKPNSN